MLDSTHVNDALKAAMMFRFAYAPPRWKGEAPRSPGKLLGETGIILDGPFPDGHDWGGLYGVLVNGEEFQYYGDFMEVIV